MSVVVTLGASNASLVELTSTLRDLVGNDTTTEVVVEQDFSMIVTPPTPAAFNALEDACKKLYPSCALTTTADLSRRRMLAEGEGTATFSRVLTNSSAGITDTPQLEAANVSVGDSTFSGVKAVLSVTTLGGAEEANALSEGSLSPDTVSSAVAAGLNLNEAALSVVVEKPIFPPMPPPSLPPSPSPPPPSPPS
eukprot:scaffold126074_cov54-Phaeocystis_antarctica.AAC.1